MRALGVAVERGLKPYVVCTNPRSGSSLLCRGLSDCGAGRPREWFNRKFRKDAQPGAPLAEYVDYVLDTGLSNGVFGVKLHFFQMLELRAECGGPWIPRLERLFSEARFIWLRRRNVERQAISYYRAGASGEWWRTDKGPFGYSGVCCAPYDPVSFDATAIQNRERSILKGDKGWQQMFLANANRPLEVFYEDFIVDYAGTLRHITEWLGLDPGIDIPDPVMKRQSDEVTEDWLLRYLSFKAAA